MQTKRRRLAGEMDRTMPLAAKSVYVPSSMSIVTGNMYEMLASNPVGSYGQDGVRYKPHARKELSPYHLTEVVHVKRSTLPGRPNLNVLRSPILEDWLYPQRIGGLTRLFVAQPCVLGNLPCGVDFMRQHHGEADVTPVYGFHHPLQMSNTC